MRRGVFLFFASMLYYTSGAIAATSPPSEIPPLTRQDTAVKGETSPVDEESTRTQDRKQEVYAFLSDGPFSYTPFLNFLSVEDLPVLYGILEETECYQAWGNAASAIGILGPSTASYQALTSYIIRPAEFREVSKLQELQISHRVNMLTWKLSAIRWLPLLKPGKGTRCLRKILASEEAAKSFLKDWDDEDIPSGFGDIRRAALELRAAAAEGLILHDAKAHRAEVRRQIDLLDRLEVEMPAPGKVKVSEDEATENGRTAMLRASLCHVLAIADYVDEHGRTKYLIAIGSFELANDMSFRLGGIMHSID